MKKMVIAALMLALGTLQACACEMQKVQPGEVGVKVYLAGSNKGVDHEILGVGRYYLGINEELYKFPVYEQNYVWTASAHEGAAHDESITFQTQEGMNVNADIGISYHIKQDMVATVFQKYRKGIEDITHVFLRNAVRDALQDVASHRPVEAVYGAEKMDMLKQAQEIVAKEVGPIGIEVTKISAVGEFRLPENVTKALNSKIEATQRAQQRENELREAEAEAKKKVAAAEGEAASQLAIAEAQAKANRLLSESLTPQLVEYERIKRWNGILPQITSGATPFVTLGNAVQK